MSTITTKDGTQIYYKDCGEGQSVVFSHGWPLSADDWDTQMMFFLNHGYRVIATSPSSVPTLCYLRLKDRPWIGVPPSQGRLLCN